MRRRTSPLPMRPSPIIPSCIAAPLCLSISRCVHGPELSWSVHASWSVRRADLVGLRADEGEQPGVIGGDRDLHHAQLTNGAESSARPPFGRAGIPGGDAHLTRDETQVHERSGITVRGAEVRRRLAEARGVDLLLQLLDELASDDRPVRRVRAEELAGRRVREPLDVAVLQAERLQACQRLARAVENRLSPFDQLLRGGTNVW